MDLMGAKLRPTSALKVFSWMWAVMKENFPKTKQVVQDAYLEAAEKFGITYTAIACNELDNFNMVAPKGYKDRTIALRTIINCRDG